MAYSATFCRIGMFASLLALMPLGNASEQWNFARLMGELAGVNHARLQFSETKKSIFLIFDTTTKGEMEYRAPDYMVKDTQSPFREKVVIDGDHMSIEKIPRPGRAEAQSTVQNYSVESHALLKAAVQGLRAMLTGNYALVNDNYDVDFQGDRTGWCLSLVPKQAEIQQHIARMELNGAGIEIAEIVTVQADGDVSTLRLSYISVR